MVVLETHARLLLIVHAVLGAATVAVATHLALWLRKAVRGTPRTAGIRWFGLILLLFFAGEFAVGNLLYPTYKVRVRAAYFDLPGAASDAIRLERQHRQALAETLGRGDEAIGQLSTPRLGRIARLFDIKEHLVALALPLVLGAWLLSRRWKPDDDPRSLRLLYGFAIAVAGVTWFAALVGIVTASYRAVGS